MKNAKEVLKAWDMYMQDRPTLNKYGTEEFFPCIPSIFGFHKWLKSQNIDKKWKALSYRNLVNILIEYDDAKLYIDAEIEDCVINGAMIKNYDGSFARALTKQKMNWENEVAIHNEITIVGLDGLELNEPN